MVFLRNAHTVCGKRFFKGVPSVYPADLAIIVALPFIHKGAGFLEEPFFAWAPVTPLERLVAGRWCQLVSCFVAKTD